MRKLTTRERLLLAILFMALLVLAVGGMVVRWVGSLKPAQRRPLPQMR
jgi:hypothetical protein